MTEQPELKPCPFKGCQNRIAADEAACPACVYKLHAELCRQFGITDPDEIRAEWERRDQPCLN